MPDTSHGLARRTMTLVDFTLVLSRAVEDRSILTFALQVLAADGIAAITEPMHRSCDLARVAPVMAYPGPGRDVLLAAGLELGRALFPELVVARFRQVLAAARAQGTAVRLRLLGGAALQHLPWEYAILPPEQGEETPTDFIALLPQVSLVREQEGVPRTGRTAATRTLRILGCVAAPPTAGAIDVAHERQLLETVLARTNVTLRWTERGRRPSAGGAADLFHFAGHGEFEAERIDAGTAGATRDVTVPLVAGDRVGSGKGVLVFDDGAGGEDRVRASDLAIVLRELGVRVAVLNTCEGATRDARRWWSSAAAALLHGGIGSVVAMQHKILDASALAFATAFYRALADGRSLDDAVRDGRIAVFERDGFGWGTPVLYLSTDDNLASSASTPGASQASAATPDALRGTTAAPITLPGWTGAPRHLAWSIDGTKLAASDGQATCMVWECAARWQVVRRMSIAAVSHCCGWIDNRLVIARGDRLYLVEGGEHEIARVESPIRCVLPLRSIIACVDAAGGAYLYEPEGRLLDRTPLGPEPWAEAATSPHDDSFAVATAGGRLAVWGAGRRLVTAKVPEGITAIAFAAPDVVAAVLVPGVLTSFAIEKRRLLRLADEASVPVRPPIAIARGRVAMATATNDVAIHTFALPSPPRVAASVTVPTGDVVRCLAWSPDGTCLAVGTASAIVLHAAT